MNIPKISAERFTYELYEPNFWQRLGFEFSTDDDIVLKKAIKKAIGYCESERLAVRPKAEWLRLCAKTTAAGLNMISSMRSR